MTGGHVHSLAMLVGDLLAVPMQHILKYHLLLRELLQNTPQSHEEYHTIHQVSGVIGVKLLTNKEKQRQTIDDQTNQTNE